MENAFINVKNRSHVIAADVEVPAGGQGVIVAQGGRFGGWSLYMKGGRIFYQHNLVGRFRYTVSSAQRIPAGRATIRYEFTYEGGGPGRGGSGAIFLNARRSRKAAGGNPNVFAMEGADVGMDLARP
jgi:arylsulfatase